MKPPTIILWLLLLAGCSSPGSEICRSRMGGRVMLEQAGDTSWALLHIAPGGDTLSRWPLPYTVYKADYGNLAGDEEPEIAIGVQKACKYWPGQGKRLFIFKLYQGELIRPLWLGSRTAFRLEDFRIERDSVPARVITDETRESDSTPVKVQYAIKGFGIRFEKFIE